MAATKNQPERRTGLIDVAAGVFARYGFKKTSMDDVARAAGLSRQGLYLHFENKIALFKAVADEFAARIRVESRTALAQKNVDLETRLLDAFMAAHGGAPGNEHIKELVASCHEHAPGVLEDVEKTLIADVAKALRAETSVSWKAADVSPNDLAELLSGSSAGIKHIARSPAEYRKRMSVAARLICRRADPTTRKERA